MARRILFRHPKLREFMLARAGVRMLNDDVGISVVDDDGKLIGGCAFTLYTGAGGSITVHVAGDRGWVSRTLIVTLFHYVFGVADCRKVFAPVHETNAQMLAILPRMGFRAEHTVLDVYPGEQRDLILFGMYKHECHWLRYPLRGAGSGVVFHG